MGFVNLHTKSIYIQYKNRLCSNTSLIIFFLTFCVITLPFLLIYLTNYNLWINSIIVYEKPNIQFKYKYIYIAETMDRNKMYMDFNNNIENTINSELITCSSYDYYNQATNDYQKFTSFKIVNNDNKSDKIKFEIEHELKENERVKQFSLMMIFSSLINSQCEFNIPTILIINQAELPVNFQAGDITYYGQFIFEQNLNLVCPHYMRKIKSNFNFTFIDNNSTVLDDFNINTIYNRLLKYRKHPGYVIYKNNFNNYQNIYQDTNNKFKLKFIININDLMFRYEKTIWQRLNGIWIEYLSLFFIFTYLFHHLKTYLFDNRYLVSLKVNPIKKR